MTRLVLGGLLLLSVACHTAPDTHDPDGVVIVVEEETQPDEGFPRRHVLVTDDPHWRTVEAVLMTVLVFAVIVVLSPTVGGVSLTTF